MSANSPLRVSVVIPCHNYEQYLDVCLDSVLTQEGVNVDVTVIDDTSTDSSRDIVRRRITLDARVRLIEHDENKGHIDTFNEALFSATAPYVVKLDPDDLLTPGSLQRSAAVLDAHPDAVFVYGTAIVFEGEVPVAPPVSAWAAKLTPGGEWLTWMSRHARNPIFQPEIMIRTSALAESGGHRHNIPAASDFNLWLRLAARGSVARIDGAIQGLYRVHAQSMQRTVHSGRVEDLTSRARAFEAFLEESADLLDDVEYLRRSSARTLARDARELAFEELDSGGDPHPLIREGALLYPPIVRSPSWRVLIAQVQRGSVWWAPLGRRFRRLRWRLRWWQRWAMQKLRTSRARGAAVILERNETSSAWTRLCARVQVFVFRAVTAMVDAGSLAVRFGVGHAVRRRLLERTLVSLTAAPGHLPETASSDRLREPRTAQPTVVLVTRTLGMGGVEAIVATLAIGLPEHGLDCIVFCEQGGSTADALRALGVVVIEARDEASAASALNAAGPVAAAQLHNAPEHLIAACVACGIPIVPVVHTTDINLSAKDWLRQSELVDRSAAVIAVSETVRAFYEHYLPRRPSVPVTVVSNGVNARISRNSGLARARLGDAIGAEIGKATVIACLARYDIQKNIPGLVRAFLDAAGEGHDALLIVAGPVEDWLEYAHADAVRRAHLHSGRVHLLGPSSSLDILDAADVFVLDSFFEGWPVAASEAVMAGLPLVISDVGGAQELAGDKGERGVICENPGAAPATITLAQIRAARRRGVQTNRAELATAIGAVCQDIPRWRKRRDQLAVDAAQWLGADAMVASHARLLQGVRVAVEEAT